MKNDFETSIKERQARITVCEQIRTLAIQKQYSELAPEISQGLGRQEALSIRRLLENEVRTLSTVCRCRSSDWSKVRFVLPTVQQGNDQSSLFLRYVSDTYLDGTVVFVGTGLSVPALETPADTQHGARAALKARLPMGIHSNGVVSDAILHLTARVHRNTCLANTYVGPDAVVTNCGTISYQETRPLGLLKLTVGPESGGGRNITVPPEVTLPDVVAQMTIATATTTTTTTPQEQQQQRLLTLPTTMNVLDTDTVVRDTPTVENVFLHPHASIEAASSVSGAILCSHALISNGSVVRNVALQWNAAITDSSSVTDAVLMEEAHAGPHSIAVNTILGPDVHVSAGEIHASVLGPNTNAHHQSLLIGVLWPLGRGNVGYGANVGSNHTGRLPDQECAAGEGTFWGLSTVIKFPVDLSLSPYSIVAAGTSLSPQRITMPFSLIVAAGDTQQQSQQQQQGMNDIIPGWLLRSSPYTIARNEIKYATRRKAKRHAHDTGWRIIRSETVAMCWEARELLRTVDDGSQSPLHVPGIGNNRLSEKGRRDGIAAYTNCIQRFALQGLWNFLLRQRSRTTTTSSRQHAEEESSSLEGGDWNLSQMARMVQDELEASAVVKPELVQPGLVKGSWSLFPWEIPSHHTDTHHGDNESDARDWPLQRYLLQTEFDAVASESCTPTTTTTVRVNDNNNNNDDGGNSQPYTVEWVRTQLMRLVTLEREYAQAIYKSKHRDDIRGAEIIPGYAEAHVSAEDDPVIQDARRRVETLEQSILPLC